MYVYALIHGYGSMFARTVAVFLTAEEAVRYALDSAIKLSVVEIKNTEWTEFVIDPADYAVYGDLETI